MHLYFPFSFTSFFFFSPVRKLTHVRTLLLLTSVVNAYANCQGGIVILHI